MGTKTLFRRLESEVAAAGVPAGPGDETRLTEADNAGIPAAARRYLLFMGVVGPPRDWSFRVRIVGRFRLRPGSAIHEPWKLGVKVPGYPIPFVDPT